MNSRQLTAWALVGCLGVLGLVWAFPRAYPLFPDEWTVSKADAEAIALERLRDLGEMPVKPYIVAYVRPNSPLEHRLQELVGDAPDDALRGSRLASDLMAWEVTVYEHSADARNWSYRVRVGANGRVTELMQRVPPEAESGRMDLTVARETADRFLTEQGFDLANYDSPGLRSILLEGRTDRVLSYRDKEALLGPDLPYGIDVTFAGERLAGFSAYFDDPQRAAIQSRVRPLALLEQAWVFVALLLLPVVGVPFVLRYHEGEVGVARGVEIACVILGCGVVTMLFCAAAVSGSFSFGLLSRQQVTWVTAFQMLMLFFFPISLLAFLSWSVGESIARAGHGERLAGLDALFRGAWSSATLARGAVRGVVGGVVVLAGLWLLALPMRFYGAWPSTAYLMGAWWESATWFSVPLLTFGVAYALYTACFGQLLLVSAAERWLGSLGGGTLAAVLGGLLFFPLIYLFPLGWSVGFWILAAGGFVLLFIKCGLFTAGYAYLVAWVLSGALPFLMAGDTPLQFQASLAIFGVALPLIVSVRHLMSGKEFVYRFIDVPPHVRRIAERERQKVELETARRIQSSILPALPPQLHGVAIAHTYLPASEVGGDFYDVLARQDGRLAVAVGDVAGHGVSSGLVMSMAKSALAVQVTFDPDVRSVFRTLNRTVYQSARERLLATLCYALIEPSTREIRYASAGHLFPYKVSPQGEVRALESVSYPLGVRRELEVVERTETLDADDCLFLFSDGVIEAYAEGSDEPFGFDRLELSLERHAGNGAGALRDGVLADLDAFTHGAPRLDDLTVLALQFP